MHWESRERSPRNRLQRKPLVNDPGLHHVTCVTHVPWCMSRSLTRGVWENVSDIPGACATRNFTYLVKSPRHGMLGNKIFHPSEHELDCVGIFQQNLRFTIDPDIGLYVPQPTGSWDRWQWFFNIKFSNVSFTFLIKLPLGETPLMMGQHWFG